ncbi:SAM-dependent methyltransferase [Ignisphaera sp. 4213-co]|uniref:SAM-dependent methyltransferase n=1 Tax=Ignisphaera cupida TaxID=3050454 RepID=A0ABD4Z522_9CREN|nr:SAM-dependent methyltransferase [Ignisphaera sp. 4213-co]MDK6028250.1 SAM-dependent methyltransferase [Ignisphaera sp. 4213-co]
MYIVIEHLEPCINKWILKEYEFVAKIFNGRVIFANVKNEKDLQILKKLGIVYKESVIEFLSNNPNVIVLDPMAYEELTTDDMKHSEYVVIGGIMGSHPPNGKTNKLITSKLPFAKARNIGKHQYTIAGAAYVAKLIESGKKLSEIKYVFGLKITKKLGKELELEIELPYAFPINEYGDVILPENYLTVVAEFVPVFESRILAGNNNVCQDEDDKVYGKPPEI